jgi:hypothetical protein
MTYVTNRLERGTPGTLCLTVCMPRLGQPEEQAVATVIRHLADIGLASCRGSVRSLRSGDTHHLGNA